MSTITKPNTFTAGTTAVASQVNADFDTIYADYNGNITNVNISASAAIADTKLAQITTASKVSGTALTGLASTPSGAGVLPIANLATGTADGTKYIRDDGTLQTPLLPSGVICMWSGTIATIPSGWYLCNGSNSTPDLRNRFIVCADADDGGVAKTTLTGSATQSGNSNIAAHSHAGGIVSGTVASGAAGAWQGGYTSDYGTGTETYPKYYALAYIMKS